MGQEEQSSGAAEMQSSGSTTSWPRGSHSHGGGTTPRKTSPASPKGGKGSDDAPSSQELNNGARQAEHSFAWPGDPILSHQPHVVSVHAGHSSSPLAWEMGCTNPGTPRPSG